MKRRRKLSRNTSKIPLIVAVFEQNISNAQRKLDFATTRQDWIEANNSQIRINTATELLEVVKALGIKKEEQGYHGGFAIKE